MTMPSLKTFPHRRPAPADAITATMSRQVRDFSRSHWRSVPPSTNSIARNTRPSNVPTSWIVTTWGWVSLAIALASRMSRVRLREPTPSAWSTLSATLRSSSGS